MCVGTNSAMYEMIVTVGEVLRRFRIQPGMESIELNPLISLKPKEGPLRLVQRANN